MTIRIGIIAGEPSGDLLGARLIAAIRSIDPDVIFEGIAGPAMCQAGCHVLSSLEPLTVMGIVEVIARLPILLRLRSRIVRHFLANPPDVFIGIDAPDFNLPIELKLKQQGIKTIHYTSPSVWAWRRGRLKTIAKATDLMLTLFPFEPPYYEEKHIPVQFVGHTLADDIPLQVNKAEARTALGLPIAGEILVLLPGSRHKEIQYLAPDFLQAAKLCLEQRPQLKIIVPMVNEQRSTEFAAIAEQVAPDLPLTILVGQTRAAIAAADVALAASGTVTLEILLLKRPMVVAYRFAFLSYCIARLLVRLKYFSLPNLLAKKALVPEFFQNAVTPENLSQAVLAYFANVTPTATLVEEFQHIHLQLRRGASRQAALAVLGLIKKANLTPSPSNL